MKNKVLFLIGIILLITGCSFKPPPVDYGKMPLPKPQKQVKQTDNYETSDQFIEDVLVDDPDNFGGIEEDIGEDPEANVDKSKTCADSYKDCVKDCNGAVEGDISDWEKSLCMKKCNIKYQFCNFF